MKKRKQKKILYPEYTVSLCTGDDALTAEAAKKLLGWQEEKEGEDFGTDYLIKDIHDVKIRCNFNTSNRWLYFKSVLVPIRQEILRGHWCFNGEPTIIGKYGSILDNQHTLVALVLAYQMWEADPDEFPYWEEEPVIEKLVVFGVDECDRVVNTINTGKTRSLTDVLYRSHFFKDLGKGERKKAAKVCSVAVNFIWERTGASNAFAEQQTHSELTGFLEMHPRILETVEHVIVENGGDNSIRKYVPLGYAAGMMYLMGCSGSDPDAYKREPHEETLDWDMWDKATDFIMKLGGDDKTIKPLTEVFSNMLRDEDGGSRQEKFGTMAKAWNQWAAKGKLSSKQLKLRYKMVDGVKTLVDHPTFGGVDGLYNA